MRKEARILQQKGADSLILAIDCFNRVWDRGRAEAVLILLDRSFELLLKSIIIHKGGKIREKNKDGTTIGFDLCLRKCLSDAKLKCLDEDEVVSLQALNSLRDAAQHYIVELSEEHLYVYAQSAVTLFSKLSEAHLGIPLSSEVPQRVLPVCARPPSDLTHLFDVEFSDIKKMLAPKSRKRLDVKAKLRSLAILQSSLDGKKSQPSDRDLNRIVTRVINGDDWRAIFPGVAKLHIDPDSEGPGLAIRITKKEGDAVHLVDSNDPNATVVAVKRTNELDFYNLGADRIARKLGVTRPKLLKLIELDDIQSNADYFKVIRIESQSHKRYSQLALRYLEKRLKEVDINEVWEQSKMRIRRSC